MSGLIQQSFKINLKVMQFCHLYPPEKQQLFFKLRAHVMHVVFVMAVPTLGTVYLLTEKNLNMERVNYNAGFLAQTACFITKLLPFITNGQRIKRLIDYFDHNSVSVINEEQRDIVNKCVEVCRRNTFIFLVCVTGGVGSWAAKPLFWNGRNLPVDVWLPFDWRTNNLVYGVVYFFVTIGVLFSSFATGVIDPLIAGLAYHATSQIKILKDNLEHLSDYADNIMFAQNLRKLSPKILKHKLIFNSIKQCVEHHNTILSFVKEYEDCFSSVIFSQFAASVFVICFSCLQLSKVDTFGFTFLQLIMYFSVILAQIYFYCYYGSTLFEESNTITNAVYMGQWYDYEIKSKLSLIILMERSKRPLTVTVGKLLDLSLVTFATILRRSYSLLAVLKNYQ
ncbi:odorant receptor Or1-like [Zophobas morio]|uniref:odorant receptor Or1-like n=1 Tax=Zophobas morio TaxID=2755281 RepID=UPI003083706C